MRTQCIKSTILITTTSSNTPTATSTIEEVNTMNITIIEVQWLVLTTMTVMTTIGVLWLVQTTMNEDITTFGTNIISMFPLGGDHRSYWRMATITALSAHIRSLLHLQKPRLLPKEDLIMDCTIPTPDLL
jgi:hypothetical protein